MTDETLVTIIIPTWNNREFLEGALMSLLRYQGTPGLMRILVINNGHPNSCDWVVNKQVEVIQTGGKNLGWEGGIDLGLRHTTSEFVCFFNDDAFIPPASRNWLNTLLAHFQNPQVAAVGPTSNVVMGLQNIFLDTGNLTKIPVTYLIGFCVLIRRKAFDEIGGMDVSLPSGDDLDWSIRFRDAGYVILADREVFVYHHGFKTGTRIMGDHQTAGGWNSYEMHQQTTIALIKKHGVKKWWECIKGVDLNKLITATNNSFIDSEGDSIRGMITDEDKKILDLGCGGNKTLDRAVGVDFVPKGEQIKTLDGVTTSQSDLVADLSKDIPVEDGSQDVIIARHILEHMVNPITALGLWGRKLRTGGKLIIAVPNHEWFNTIPMNMEHVHAYTPESLTSLLAVFGFGIKEIKEGGNNISFIAEAVKQ